MAMDTINHQ